MEGHRAQRVSETLREELDELIGYEMADPRISISGVTEVLVTPDMRHAQVRVRLCGDTAEQRDTLEALEGARHFLRRTLAARVQLFRIPELHFEADVSAELGTRIDHLLKRVKKGRPKDV